MLASLIPPRTCPLPATGGRLGDDLADFRVDEVALYEPSGSGDHLYVRIEKQGLTTPDLVTLLSRVSGAKERDIGYAGMKDKHGITSQWLSLPGNIPRAPETWDLGEVAKVVAVSRHKNKLRTGHLTGNRFTVRITGADAPENAAAIAEQLSAGGVLNYFGAQRFGRNLENFERAVRWLRDGANAPGKRARFYRKLYPSVIQSEVFNRYVSARVERGLAQILDGEVVRIAGRTSLFVVEDVAVEQARYTAGELCLVGPMPGPKALPARAEALALEQESVASTSLTEEDLARLAPLAPGTRRDLILELKDLVVTAQDQNRYTLSFSLPSGAYATQVVREFTGAPFGQDGRVS